MIDRVFARQHALITLQQAQDAGLTALQVRHKHRTGRWVRVGGGVYRLAGAPVTWQQRALAACLIAGSRAVVSHRPAAVLLGISGFRPGRLEITVPPGMNNRNPLATVHRSRLETGDRTTRDHVPVTSPARTLVDLARTVPEAVLAEAVDDVLCRRLVTLERLTARAVRVAALRTVLEAWTPGGMPGSVAEMALVRRLLEAGLPPPERQYWIAPAHARVDLAYPRERLAIELDSFRWHAGRAPFLHDRSRGNRIVAAGWQLLRAAPGDMDGVIAAAQRLTLKKVS